jgi:multidrug resistance efflux pump
MKELTLQQEQLAGRQEKLQIKSPVHGVVLSGELERAEGAALTTGQSLLEVAPLDDLLVEIAVPEDQLRFIEPGSAVALKLDAFPGRKWRGAVERVRPVAEIRDAQNVFIAEIRLQNEEGSLRPGMKGRAKVTGPVRPFVWIFLHRPYEAVLQWLGW